MTDQQNSDHASGQPSSGMDDETTGGMSEQDLGTGSAEVSEDEGDLDGESVEGESDDSEEDDVESTGQTGSEDDMSSGVEGTSGSGGSYGN